MDKKTKQALSEAYEQLMKISLNQLPIDGLEELVHPDTMGWGTTVEEEIFGLEDYIKLIENQEKAARKQGLIFKFDRDRIHEHYSPQDDTALFVEKIQASIKTEDQELNFIFRFSALMELEDGQWKMVHWHGSIPSDIEDDTWHVNEWKKEKEKLEQKVAEQTAALKDKNEELVIVAALERVRGKSMGMQRSEELVEVVQLLHKELLDLGVEHDATVIMTYPDNKQIEEASEIWIAVEGQKYFSKFNFPYVKDSPIATRHRQAILDDVNLYTDRFTKKEKDDFFNYQFEHGDLKNLPEERKQYVLNSSGLVRAVVSLKNSALIINRYSNEAFSEKHVSIIEQFGNVFEQAFTRFLDLQKAEQLAYEAHVEASLERVRAMAAAMNHSDDLKQIAETMFQELEILKIEPLRYGVGLIDGQSRKAELWASEVNDGQYLNELGTISMDLHPMLQKGFQAWEDQYEELTYELKGEELRNYYQGIAQVNPHIPNIEELTAPDSGIIHYWCFFPFRTGGLYAFTLHPPEEQGISILKRFANVFEQAYTRFEDLHKTEEQAQLIRLEKERLEEALNNLRATQEQLVQQEKLASLGQLTAGIAHEIKNPLNFVNNFSDLNLELMSELRAELQKEEPDPEEITFLLDSLHQNTSKVLEHGNRADRIVKSMLQHARGGSGTMETNDLNVLVKEFVNLSFHGMRAGKEPINVELNYDMADNLPQVPLKTEDFSRVIVNICNNAFDAMRLKIRDDKKREYAPVLSVKTSKENDRICVELEDNGPGIPEELKDKILQPFFTTKKGKEGTGLGLSISHDIIKSHGGSMAVETNSMDFTRFKIYLPIGSAS